MSSYPRHLIETSTYVTSVTEAQGLWKPWEQLQNRYNHIWPNGQIPAMQYLVVAGGGGTGGAIPAGGGAGGMVVGTTTSTLLTFPLTVTIGTGGPHVGAGVTISKGLDSVLGPIIAFGGGAAGTSGNGGNGGSGGGGGFAVAAPPGGLATQVSYPTYGGIGYGNRGGAGNPGGGGGAGGASGNANGDFGAGRASSITGVSVTYAAGGPAQAGSSNVVANSGNGGGGGFAGSTGIVVIAYPIWYQKINVNSGLTYTYSNTARSGYHLFKFTAGSGTIDLPTSNVNY